jgi:hypothetical protein
MASLHVVTPVGVGKLVLSHESAKYRTFMYVWVRSHS